MFCRMDCQGQYSDRVLARVDRWLRRWYGLDAEGTGRASPAGPAVPSGLPERRLSGRLMRVNHAGEVCAQALYHGQARVARTPERRLHLQTAAREEGDHLRWCRARLQALRTEPSRLGPVWYGGAYAAGLLAGLAGDRISLGFVEETEQQVAQHLQQHLQRLPATDPQSRAVLERMRQDELQHSARAREAGGQALPGVVRGLMRRCARVMIGTAYYI